MKYTYESECIDLVLKRLAEACALSTDTKTVALICGSVANLVGLTHYGQAQATSRVTDLMHMADRHGFASEFYGNGVRVSYTKPTTIGSWRTTPAGADIFCVDGEERGHTWTTDGGSLHHAQRYSATQGTLESATFRSHHVAKAWIEAGVKGA